MQATVVCNTQMFNERKAKEGFFSAGGKDEGGGGEVDSDGDEF